MATNKTTSQMSGGIITNITNEKMENEKIWDKKKKILSISKRQVKRILKKNWFKEK